MQIEKRKMIGIVGGMGPYAGLDLVKKIFDLSQANQDQDHVPLAMISVPHKITDRTKFLEGETDINPGIEISNVVRQLSDQGASVIGMPCNTAHSSKIINEIYNSIPEGITFVNMVLEVIKFIKGEYPDIERVGILATTGTLKSDVYNKELINNDLKPVLLSKGNQKKLIDQAIYDKDFGIKSISSPVHDIAKRKIHLAIESLIKNKAEVVILGCTELPLAVNATSVKTIPLIDSTMILARSLLFKSNHTVSG